jgi:ABC-type multidrug transport system ATPase subunit
VVAQALIGPPDLVVLDEPSGGLDADGVHRVSAEIARVATRSSALIHLLTSAISGLHLTGW